MIQCNQRPGDETWEKLKAQVSRMAGLEGFPKAAFEPAAFKELVLALQCANSVEEATGVIDDMIECETICPKPAQIRMRINSIHESNEGSPAIQEIEEWKRVQDHMAPTLKEKIAAHSKLVAARLAELKKTPALNKVGPDGQKQQTALRDALKAATDELAGGVRPEKKAPESEAGGLKRITGAEK